MKWKLLAMPLALGAIVALGACAEQPQTTTVEKNQ